MTNDLYPSKAEFESVFKKNIRATSYSLSIKTLFGDRYSRKIDYSPYYQRNYVWDNAKASFFIESILLGTDIPPLIFFNNGASIEIIDGRQRFETIKRFNNDEFKLNLKGLTKLTQIRNTLYSRLDSEIRDVFSDAKIRVFEFEVFNEPRLTPILEDKVKKEIFRRYNSGITPLNTAEIDNASYDDDDLTKKFRATLQKDPALLSLIERDFLGKRDTDIAKVLQFLRRNAVLSSFPIRTYAMGGNRSEITELLYDFVSDNITDMESFCEKIFESIKLTSDVLENCNISSWSDTRYLYETFLWGVIVLKENEFNVDSLKESSNLDDLNLFLKNNKDNFLAEKSHHYKSIIQRFTSIACFYKKIYHFDFSDYIRDDQFKSLVKNLRQTEKEAKLKLSELATLRVHKPEPSFVPVEEIINELSNNRYMVRPSYQRQEKINLYKASSIIESMILGISLPPIFIFKNSEGVKEVIDGQQRLLAILGFLGKKYQDDKGEKRLSKNHKYKLNRLKVLRELSGLRYDDLEFSLQDKILDFRISVIEIDYKINKDFDPVDLFIRLNNKPYPIKDNSFEMWNSFVDREIITKIKNITDQNIDWFYIKKRKDSSKTADRMLNEELITLLSYIDYNSTYRKEYGSIGYYLRGVNINCRISDKKDVSTILEKVSTDVVLKKRFLNSISLIEKDISSLHKSLENTEDDSKALDLLFNRGESNRRYLVDFYALFQILKLLREKSLNVSDLSLMLSAVQNELNNPPESSEVESYQKHFGEFFQLVVAPYQTET